MAVSRISRNNLLQILDGIVKERHDVVIKFYGNDCHLCHSLKDHYLHLSNQYNDVNFYAFNMEDGAGIDSKYGFEGVPAICMVNTGLRTTYKFMSEPEKPDKKSWYTLREIKTFIEENKR